MTKGAHCAVGREDGLGQARWACVGSMAHLQSRKMSSSVKISLSAIAGVMSRYDMASENACKQRAGDWHHSAAQGCLSGCKSVSQAAPAVKQLPLPWMRSEPKTSAEGVVALVRALQASRLSASSEHLRRHGGRRDDAETTILRRKSYVERLKGVNP